MGLVPEKMWPFPSPPEDSARRAALVGVWGRGGGGGGEKGEGAETVEERKRIGMEEGGGAGGVTWEGE